MINILDSTFLEPFKLTFELATITTMILYIIGTPIAYFIAYSKSKITHFFEALISLPLVLPPSVLGFYFLLLFSNDGFIGKIWKEIFGHQLVFHFEGLVLGSIIFSLPFMIHPLISGMKSIPLSQIEASYTMGKSTITTLFRVILPSIKPSIITAGVLSFAHTVGEFGVVLMIGGDIEGETKVASIAIYDEVEALNYTTAHIYSSILFIFSFAVLWLVYVKLSSKRDIL